MPYNGSSVIAAANGKAATPAALQLEQIAPIAPINVPPMLIETNET